MLLAEAFELQRLQKFEQAEEKYRTALGKSPDHAQGWYYRGLSAEGMCREDIAINCYEKCRTLGVGADVLLRLGRCYIALHQEDRAVEIFHEALKQEPANSEMRLTLAVALITQKKLDQAEDHLRRLIEKDKTCYHAFRHLVKVTTVSPQDTMFQQMLDLADEGDAATYPLQYALAEIYDQNGEQKKYFEHLTKANELQMSLGAQDMSSVLAPFGKIKQAFSHEDAAIEKSKAAALSTSVSSSVTPIFIVGLPRSGTTLLEQILSGHGDVYAGDELPYMRQVVVRHLSELTGPPFPEAVKQMTPEITQQLAEDYQHRLHMLAPDYSMVTDKNPENFFTIGLIIRLFPEAKIIHMQRDLRDVGLSLYHQCFSYPAPYFNDLSAMADYMKAFEDLMQHWHRHYPGQIHSVQYEELLVEPEKVGRGLFEYCGLEWQSSFVNFHERSQTVRSLTSLQVRQPLHQDSMGKWRRHEGFMKPLLDKLM